jgi:hypothetical protein
LKTNQGKNKQTINSTTTPDDEETHDKWSNQTSWKAHPNNSNFNKANWNNGNNNGNGQWKNKSPSNSTAHDDEEAHNRWANFAFRAPFPPTSFNSSKWNASAFNSSNSNSSWPHPFGFRGSQPFTFPSTQSSTQPSTQPSTTNS